MNILQKRILDVFKVVNEIIEKNNLIYFAIGGTAIGAARHQGFIPWDDDLDIAMPRDDYETLMMVLPQELPEHLELRTHGFSKSYCAKFSKVIDKTTTIIEGKMKTFSDLDEGVYIDIFPVDKLPNGVFARKKHILNFSVLNKLDYYTTLSYNTYTTLPWKLGYTIARPLKYLVPKLYFRNKFYQETVKYNTLELAQVAFKWDYPTLRNIVFDADWMDCMQPFPFEDTTISMLKNYDQYLTMHFGNYMALPPQEKCVSHHGFIVVDFKTPYREYRKNHDIN